MGANAGSIGIDHVGSETDSLARPQAAASAALIRWLLQKTSDPAQTSSATISRRATSDREEQLSDKLFGPVHSQATIAAWVAANVANV